MVRLFSVLLTFSLAISAGPSFCFAQNKNNKSKSAQEKRDDEKVQNAKDDVKDAQGKLKSDQKELQEAQRALTAAEDKEKLARQHLDDVRKQIAAKHERSSGIEKALTEQAAAKQAFEEAAAPVLKSLRENAEYQAAAKKVEDAKTRLKTLRDETSLSAEAKRKEIAQASKDALAASDLETKALDRDPSAKAARAKLTEAQNRVNQIRMQIRNAVEGAPETRSALQALQSASDASETAGQKMLRIRNKVAVDAAKLGREQQQLNQAELQDKRNDGKNTKNKKPNKGSK